MSGLGPLPLKPSVRLRRASDDGATYCPLAHPRNPASAAARLAGRGKAYAAWTSVRKRRTSPLRLSASCESVSASDFTSAAVARASREVPARRLMDSALVRASADARLTPSLIE